MEKKQSFKCVICGKKETGFGNNPNPLAESGRCCDECNQEVIKARIMEIIKSQENIDRSSED